MKLLCKYLGGSTLYGLQTPTSDVDYRGVYQHEDPLLIYGFKTETNVTKQTKDEDLVLHELSAFLQLAAKSNTQTLECLFAPEDAFEMCDEKFRKLVLDPTVRNRFLNTDQLFKSLEGYLYNEMRLALGERTGLLGSKRKTQLEKYGFSPKNFSHLFRLAECGRQFFTSGLYPVRLSDFNQDAHDLCYNIKTAPEEWTAAELETLALSKKEEMRAAYECVRAEDKFFPDLDYIRFVLKSLYA